MLDQIRQIWRYKFLILAITVVVGTATALWSLRLPKIYAATVVLEFDPSPTRPLSGPEVHDIDQQNNPVWASREYFQTQQHVLVSERVTEGVTRELGLQFDPDFLGVPAKKRTDFKPVSVADAAAALRARMTVEPVRETRLMNITVEDTNPRRAQLLANTIAAVYIKQRNDTKNLTTEAAINWLGNQLQTLRTQLRDSEEALHTYRDKNNLLALTLQDRMSHLGNRISRLSDALTETQTKKIQVAAQLEQLKRAARSRDPLVMNAPELLASALLQTFRGDYEGARRERDVLATRYGEAAKEMMAVEGKIHEIEDAIRHEVRNIVNSHESNLNSLGKIEADYKAALTEAQDEAMQLGRKETDYARLVRERDNNAKLYQLVSERDKEAGLTRLFHVNNVGVLDAALMPEKAIKPNVRANIIAGVAGGIVFGLLIAFLLVQADRTVRSQLDVEEELKSTFLGVIPSIDPDRGPAGAYRYGPAPHDKEPVLNADLVVHTHPNSATAEACRVIRTNLLFMSPDEPFRTIMVSSAEPREGKTTTSICLAITLAQSGKRVLLIDTDMRRPRVHRAFKLRPPVGVTSVLVNEATLEEAVIETEVPNLFLLPCGPIPPNPAELLHSNRFLDLLEKVKAKYDRIVFDTPPVGVVTDALIMGPQVDAVVLVCKSRKTVRARASAVLSKLRSLGSHIAGVILNDVDLARSPEVSYYYYGGRYEYTQPGEGG